LDKSLLAFGIAAITLMDCKNGEKQENTSEETKENVESVAVDMHNSENSLD
jgi:hypothetical protein